jgi:hypothetical protein
MSAIVVTLGARDFADFAGLSRRWLSSAPRNLPPGRRSARPDRTVFAFERNDVVGTEARIGERSFCHERDRRDPVSVGIVPRFVRSGSRLLSRILSTA